MEHREKEPLVLIGIEDVEFRYPLPGGATKEALEGVTLKVYEGDKLVILGAGGAGKTTLSLLLAGVLEPTKGGVVRGGAPAGEGSLAVGLVSQNPEDTFTSPIVREEMGLVLQNLEWSDERIDRAVESMLAEIGLGKHADSPPALLSGGQKQLLALASVLIAEPQILLLDEPLSLLDHSSREEVSTLLDRWADLPSRTMVYLSSELEDVRRGDRVTVLSAGRVAWEGTPAALPLHQEKLAHWGFVAPDLTILAERLLAGRGRRLWRPEELADHICRSS